MLNNDTLITADFMRNSHEWGGDRYWLCTLTSTDIMAESMLTCFGLDLFTLYE